MRIESFIWLCLGSGLTLALLGLVRSATALISKQRTVSEFGDEIVLSDGFFTERQAVTLDSRQTESVNPLLGQLASIGRRSLQFNIEPTTASSSIPNAPAGSEFKIGAELTATVTSDDALYRFSARVQDIRQSDTVPGQSEVVVSRPLWLARVQRRAHYRLPVSIHATLECRSDHKQSSLVAVTIINLSGGGFCAEIGSRLGIYAADAMISRFTVGSVVSLGLPIPVLVGVPLLARVCTAERAAAPGGLAVRVACAFLPMSPHDQELLISFIFRAQKEGVNLFEPR